ncbi:hypothetical protein SLEP1_g45388 [Rubroshorea leprosula]|uniref:Uncharacterized protein n=1 Tax=Rubroshorea leprosula TaxID=152421 RepID=A0AAV5LJM2_9ROSI|nr:hypothetical protein SLEP1_g45388 [Rubroshorea leprosula]
MLILSFGRKQNHVPRLLFQLRKLTLFKLILMNGHRKSLCVYISHVNLISDLESLISYSQL